MKIPGYDVHCPSIDKIAYLCLCYSKCNKYFPTLTFLTNHKWIVHPANRGWPKEKGKSQNSSTLDDFSLLPSQQQQEKILLFEEKHLREYMSDQDW